MPDEFPTIVKVKLAERAAFICSNPSCNRITVGPSAVDQNLSTRTGVAAHICAASPGGPRYDISQTPNQRASISNGIWLCATCATLIDKNNGVDYPPEHVRRWKRDHEELMRTCLEGGKRIVFQFLVTPPDHDRARNLLIFLQQRGVLFMPYQSEHPPHVIESIKEIRTFLTQMQSQIEPESPLNIIADSINHACRHFMNTTSVNATLKEIIYGLGALRKVVGINIGQLEKVYGVTPTGPLRDAIPK